MEQGVIQIVESLITMISDAWAVPLGNDRCIVEREKVMEQLNQIKAQLPVEVAEARRLLQAREEFMENARREAESMRRVAEERAQQLLDEQQIMQEARRQGAELIRTSEGRAQELMRVTNEYVGDTLVRTEEAIMRALDEIKQTQYRFNSHASGQSQSEPTHQIETTGGTEPI